MTKRYRIRAWYMVVHMIHTHDYIEVEYKKFGKLFWGRTPWDSLDWHGQASRLRKRMGKEYPDFIETKNEIDDYEFHSKRSAFAIVGIF